MSGCANAGQALGRGLKLYTTRSAHSLPFLYQTPTLRRYYSALQDLAKENFVENNPRFKKKKQPREPTSATAHRTQPEKEEFVPFETAGSAEEQDVPVESIQGETLTGREREAFARLEALAGTPTRPAAKKKPVEDAFLSLDDVLNEAIAKVELGDQAKSGLEKKAAAGGALSKRSRRKATSTKAPKRQTKSESITLKPAPAPTALEDHKTEKQRLGELNVRLLRDEETNRAALTSAPTDIALWKTLETDLFTPIANLHLDGPPTPSTTTPPTTPEHRRHLMRVFPHHLILASTLLRTSFPTSNLILSILPRLKQLGPSVYALGVTPSLLNQLLAFHFNKYTDIDACNEILQEMESTIIEPDAKTLQILTFMLSFRAKVQTGVMGITLKAIFATDKFRRDFGELEKWARKVEVSLYEQEVREQRKARSEEARIAEEHRLGGGPVRYLEAREAEKLKEHVGN